MFMVEDLMDDLDITISYKEGILSVEIIRISDEAELTFSTTDIGLPIEAYTAIKAVIAKFSS